MDDISISLNSEKESEDSSMHTEEIDIKTMRSQNSSVIPESPDLGKASDSKGKSSDTKLLSEDQNGTSSSRSRKKSNASSGKRKLSGSPPKAVSLKKIAREISLSDGYAYSNFVLSPYHYYIFYIFVILLYKQY